MAGSIEPDPTEVPIEGGKDVTLSPGSPWPSTYRGSKYSLVDSHKRSRDQFIKWQYKGLQAVAEPPAGLVEAMQEVVKSEKTGKGSFRVTAARELLTKVHAENFPDAHEAPHASGWIPVYLGALSSGLGFDDLNNDPDRSTPAVWDGLSFNHGETWAVNTRGDQVWSHDQFTFQSAFDHPELVDTYRQFRTNPGRLYVNEYGHVWINAPADSIPDNQERSMRDMYDSWKARVENVGETAAMRMVTRRLTVTSHDDDPMNGHLPLYIGHLRDFDGGVVPRPVIDEPNYFVISSKADDKLIGN
jgi:hypothetical protein